MGVHKTLSNNGEKNIILLLCKQKIIVFVKSELPKKQTKVTQPLP